MAEVYAVNLDSVKRWRTQGMPGKKGCYVLHDVSLWLRTEGPWKSRKSIDEGNDPLLAGGDSPGLERYRLAKAKLAELDLENRKNEVIERSICRDAFAMWAVVFRRMGDALAKRFGPEAAAIVNDALRECQAIVDKLLGGDDG